MLVTTEGLDTSHSSSLSANANSLDTSHIDNGQDIDWSFIDHPLATYPKEMKLEAVSLYMSTSSLAKTADALGLNHGIVQGWMKSPWWQEVWDKLRKQKQLELDSLLTRTIHKAVADLNDRLENGDYKLNARTGELNRVPVGAKDIAVTLAIIYDKRALIRGEATAIRAESKATLESLESKFKDFALQLKEKDIVAEA